MSKRNLLLIVFSICLVLSGGCGGSKSGKSNSIVLSSDYAGYEVDYKLTYKVTYTDYEVNPVERGSFNRFRYVISVNDAGIFKTVNYNERSPYKYGFYIKKQDNKYYETGYWNEEDDYDEFFDDEYFILEDPLVKDAETELGIVLRLEKITLLGKTYDAWYIEEENDYTEDDGNLYYWKDKSWFVPNIGEVRYEYIEKCNGKIVFESRSELTSAKFEAYKADKSLLCSQSNSLKAVNQERENRSKRSRWFDREKL